MNRHERRRQAAKARHNSFVDKYVHHLPEVSGPGERGTLTHQVFYHDDWCAIYDKAHGSLLDCNCNPTVKYFTEPKRS